MATETLTAKLQFEGSAAIQGMNRASTAFTKMQTHAKMAKEGVQNLKKGFAGFNIVMAGVTAGAVGAIKKFADFDGQMGAVKAVLGKEAAPEFVKLESLASKLGATTSFTATQSAEAMENLARAGFDATQIMSAVPEVLAAAAAEGMDLGTAADIVASNIKAFQLEAKDAARVADALAFVSSKTNTNMVGLQEGMKFAAPVAKSMGIALEDTAAAIGALADVGLKGSLAGTGLKNALLKISKAAKGGEVPVGKFRAEIVKTKDGGIDLSKTMFNIVNELQKIKEPTKRAQASMKLLGLRGMGSAAAFDALGKNQKLVNTLFVNMRGNAKDAAKNMQAMRLDTLKGDFQLLSSAIDGMAISLGKVLRDYIRPFIAQGKGVTETISAAAQSITKFWGAKGELGRVFAEQDLITKGVSQGVIDFARGFVEGIRSATGIFKVFFATIKVPFLFLKNMLSPFGFLGEEGSGVKGITKLVIQAGALGLSIKLATKIFARFGNVVKGSFQVMKGVLGGVKTGLGGTVSLLQTRFPKLAKVLPAGLRKLTGAVTAAEKITAQPVRVVNFDEMGMMGGAGTAAGQMSLFGPKAGAPGAGGVTREISKLGKVASFAGKGVAVLGAGIVGWQLGRAIDQAFGLSDALSKWGWQTSRAKKLLEDQYRVQLKLNALKIAGAPKGGTAAKLATKLADISKNIGTIQQREKPGGPAKRVGLTRELATQILTKRFKGEFTAKETDALLKSVQPILDRIPTKEDLAKRPPTIVQVDGREVARAVFGASEETRDRTGGTGIFAQDTKLRGPKPRRAAKR